MKIQYGPLVITGDEDIIAKAAELDVQPGEVAGRIDADRLMKFYAVAERQSDNKAALADYLAAKEKFVAQNG